MGVYDDFIIAGTLSSGDEAVPTLNEIFMCMTGCSEIPPMGLVDPPPSITFTPSETPHFSTCAMEIVFPLTLPTDYNDFVSKMSFYIIGSPDFGSL